MFRQTVFLLLAAMSLLPGVSFALDASEIYKLAEPSVVVVLAADAKGEKNDLGSGVVISSTDVVTSCRVVEAATDMVISRDGVLRKAALQFKDAERSLCQLHLADPLPADIPAATVTSTAVAAGQEIYIVGSPRGMDRTIARTMISGLRAASGGGARLVEIDVTPVDGSLGAGVFDRTGGLVGLALGRFKAGDNASYVIPAAWIAELPTRSADLRVVAAAPQLQSPATRSAAAVADAAPGTLPHVGDRWKYRLLDGKRPVGIVTVEVVESQGNIVRERITRDDQKTFIAERIVDAAFNPSRFQEPVTMHGGFQIEEISPYAIAEQDLKSGQYWADIPATFQLVQVGKKTLLMQVRVVKQEKIRVPAGEFDATLVEATGKDYFVQTSVKVTCRFWYAAKMKRSVKMSLLVDQSVSTNNSNSETYELTAFEPAK